MRKFTLLIVYYKQRANKIIVNITSSGSENIEKLTISYIVQMIKKTLVGFEFVPERKNGKCSISYIFQVGNVSEIHNQLLVLNNSNFFPKPYL